MKHYFALLFIAIAWSAILTQPAYADTDTCGSGSQSIASESVTSETGNYTVYVKLGLPGQTANVSVYGVTSGCQLIGVVAANGSAWTPAGAITITEEPVSFEISGDIPGNNDAAARPLLLLVPASAPCTPNVTCNSAVAATPAYLIPVALTTSSSGLIVQKVVDPATDTITRVEYYTDGQLMYTQKDLQPFNAAYADYYQQKIARVVVYGSGQRAVLEDTVLTYTDTIGNFALRTYARHSTLVIVVGAALVFTILLLTVRGIARRIENRSYYNYAHGLGQHTLTPFEKKIQAFTQNRIIQTVSNVLLIAAGLVAMIIMVNSFVIAPYRVDGTSMYATLQNHQLVAVNKLPVSVNRHFKPQRGQVIIYHPNYGNLAFSAFREDNLLVKRIVGLPGERITSVNGRLMVYNTTHPQGYILENTEPWGNKVTVQKEDAPFDITLSNDEIFVAGDNRPDSVDSRINGALPLSEVIGVVIGY